MDPRLKKALELIRDLATETLKALSVGDREAKDALGTISRTARLAVGESPMAKKLAKFARDLLERRGDSVSRLMANAADGCDCARCNLAKTIIEFEKGKTDGAD